MVIIIIPLANSFSQSSNQSYDVIVIAESPETKASLDHMIKSIFMHGIIEIGHFFEKFIALMDEHCLQYYLTEKLESEKIRELIS
jgi:hypothetical protein